MFIDSKDLILELKKPKLNSKIISKFNSSKYQELELIIQSFVNIELVTLVDSSLKYNIKLEQNSKLKLILTAKQNLADLQIDIKVDLKGSNSELEIYFFSYQEINSTKFNLSICHLVKDTFSKSLIKSVALNQANFSCKGNIFIDKVAIDSEAKMNLKGLLLDKTSKIQFEPNLQIHQNQVICSHGATVSNFEDRYLEYFYSRGISPTQAKNILIQSFEADVINEIPLICLN